MNDAVEYAAVRVDDFLRELADNAPVMIWK
jgi:hypothetical protein